MAIVKDASGAIGTVMSAEDFIQHRIDDPSAYWRGSDSGGLSAQSAANALASTESATQAGAQQAAAAASQGGGGGGGGGSSGGNVLGILKLFGFGA